MLRCGFGGLWAGRSCGGDGAAKLRRESYRESFNSGRDHLQSDLQVLEEPVGEAENVDMASAPSNDEGERITIEDVTDEEGGHGQ